MSRGRSAGIAIQRRRAKLIYADLDLPLRAVGRLELDRSDSPAGSTCGQLFARFRQRAELQDILLHGFSTRSATGLFETESNPTAVDRGQGAPHNGRVHRCLFQQV